MGTITVTRTLGAKPTAVLAVLDDFGNVATWSSGVKASRTTNGVPRGLGAERHCDLHGPGEPWLKERVTATTDHSLTVTVYDSNQPLKSMLVVFDVRAAGEGSEVTITADFAMKGGPLGTVLELLVARRNFTKAFHGMLKDLDAATAPLAAAR